MFADKAREAMPPLADTPIWIGIDLLAEHPDGGNAYIAAKNIRSAIEMFRLQYQHRANNKIINFTSEREGLKIAISCAWLAPKPSGSGLRRVLCLPASHSCESHLPCFFY